MYSLYYKDLRLGVTFQLKYLWVSDFASFAKVFADFYFSRGIAQLPLVTTKTISDQFLIKVMIVCFQPIAEYVYTVGKNLLKNRGMGE